MSVKGYPGFLTLKTWISTLNINANKPMDTQTAILCERGFSILGTTAINAITLPVRAASMEIVTQERSGLV